MSLNIGCLVRKFDWMQRWRRPTQLDWLDRQGLAVQSVQVDEAHPDYFQDADQMVVFSQKTQEIWLGLGVSHVFNRLCQAQDFKGLGEGVAMVADDAHGYYGLQEFARGAAGWGAQVTTNPASMWMRQSADGTASPQRATALQSVADLLGGRVAIVEACVTAQGADAACGIAWHGQKQDWVLAVVAMDGKAYQEVESYNLLPTGTLFDAVDPPGGWPRYWRQGDLFAAMQDHLSRAWCGVGLSEITLNHPMLRGPGLLIEMTTDR